jgi:hypothetical protein
VYEYSSTLILLILAPEWTVCGLVGDCAAVVRDRSGDLISLCPPQRGEYANTTYFATYPQVLDWLDVRVLDVPVQTAAVLTDGLLELTMNVAENRPFAPFFAPLFAFVAANEQEEQAAAELAEFLTSERINARTYDDKTLVLVHRPA